MTAGRAVGVIRVSVLTDSTTSPDTQEGAIDRAMVYYGFTQVGQATDLDVSASKNSPWERPQLAAWLAVPDKYEALVWRRIDRAVRSMADMSALVAWAKENEKRLIFAEGPGGGPMELDLSGNSPVAELLTMVFAFAAQMEALAITERVTRAHETIRSTELRWSGGRAPYGYTAVERDDGPGWTLVPNEEEVQTLRDVVAWIKNGMSLNSACWYLNREGRGPTRTKRSKYWYPSTLSEVLKSQVLIGYKMTGMRKNHVPVRDADGRPILVTNSPAMSPDEFAQIQEILAQSQKGLITKRRDSNSLAFGVMYCPSLPHKMYFNRGNLDRGGTRPDVYACRVVGATQKCPTSNSIKAEWADEWISAEFLRRAGHAQTHRAENHAGSDPRPEIERTTAELETLASKLSGARSDAERRVWEWRVDGLSKRLAELEATPVEDPWTEMVPTGRTVAEDWASADTAGRREMLVEAGTYVEVQPARRRGGTVKKEDAVGRLSMVFTDPDWDALADAGNDIQYQAEL